METEGIDEKDVHLLSWSHMHHSWALPVHIMSSDARERDAYSYALLLATESTMPEMRDTRTVASLPWTQVASRILPSMLPDE
jgi:hypothetical protein